MFRQRTPDIPLVSEALAAPRIVMPQDMTPLAFRLGRDQGINLETLLAGPDEFDASAAAQAYVEGYRSKIEGPLTDDLAIAALEAITSDGEADSLLATFVARYMDTMIQIERQVK